jgi:hypothetical protein
MDRRVTNCIDFEMATEAGACVAAAHTIGQDEIIAGDPRCDLFGMANVVAGGDERPVDSFNTVSNSAAVADGYPAMTD